MPAQIELNLQASSPKTTPSSKRVTKHAGPRPAAATTAADRADDDRRSRPPRRRPPPRRARAAAPRLPVALDDDGGASSTGLPGATGTKAGPLPARPCRPAIDPAMSRPAPCTARSGCTAAPLSPPRDGAATSCRAWWSASSMVLSAAAYSPAASPASAAAPAGTSCWCRFRASDAASAPRARRAGPRTPRPTSSTACCPVRRTGSGSLRSPSPSASRSAVVRTWSRRRCRRACACCLRGSGGACVDVGCGIRAAAPSLSSSASDRRCN